jgi:hypothetical protein
VTEPETNDDTVILARLSDVVEARALRALLESEDIAVATPGLEHRALLGIAGGYVDIVVRVPNKDLSRAQELLDSLRASTPPDEAEDDKPEEKPRTDRLRRIAVFAACTLTFGCGHFYARRWRSGWIILAVEVIAIALALALPVFAFSLGGIVLADIVGSVGLIGADQRGAPPSMLARYAPWIAVLSVLAIPGARGAMPNLFAGRSMVAACARASECGSAESVDACIARAADATFEGRSFYGREETCAACLDESLCEDAPLDCAECAGLVSLPMPEPRSHTQLPPGTSADDLQIVIPDLFRHERGIEVTLPPMPDLDDLPPPSR